MAGIRIDAVNKSYGNVEVIKDFTLDVADGEFVVFVGPSGCGKSTMLKILAGLEEASAGHVFVGEEDVTDKAPGKRDVAMVFQNYALYPHLTVAGNMGFGLKMRGVPPRVIAERVKDAARVLEVDHLLHRRPKELSGGQRQRVALGRAIVREPVAFLMDEPLSNLDATLRVHMRSEISALHRRLGVTTIFVTHDQTEAMTMADRIVVMRDGAIQQVADPDSMYQNPANLFVAAFIGSPGMNFFCSRVEVEGASASVRLFGHRVALTGPLERFESAIGGNVVLGLRPEDISTNAGPLQIDILPKLIESLGSEKYIHFEIPQDNLPTNVSLFGGTEGRRADIAIAKVAKGDVSRNQNSVRLSFDPGKLHIFGESGLVL